MNRYQSYYDSLPFIQPILQNGLRIQNHKKPERIFATETTLKQTQRFRGTIRQTHYFSAIQRVFISEHEKSYL